MRGQRSVLFEFLSSRDPRQLFCAPPCLSERLSPTIRLTCRFFLNGLFLLARLASCLLRTSSSKAAASTTCATSICRCPAIKLICLTGVSGSGKSSLAFDTLYAEGQRRYVESLSRFARQFLGQMPKPDVDYISGLSPSISISQKSSGQQPALDRRHDHRNLRFSARALRPHRPRPLPASAAGRSPPRRASRSSPASCRLPTGTQVRGAGARSSAAQKGEYKDLFEDLLKQGFVRARVDGQIVSADRRPVARSPDAAQHRGRRRSADRQGRSRGRLAEAVELALETGRREHLIVAIEREDETASSRGQSRRMPENSDR